MKVAIAIRQSRNVESIVAEALRFGLTHGERIAVVTVIDTNTLRAWSLLPPPLVDEAMKFAREDAEVTVRHAALQLRTELHSPYVEEVVLDGELIRELQNFLLRWQADLLVIGASEAHLWGQHCAALVNASPCPVMVIPESAGELKKCEVNEPAREEQGVQRV